MVPALWTLHAQIAGVILESEELHRLAYNAAFERYNVKCREYDHTATAIHVSEQAHVAHCALTDVSWLRLMSDSPTCAHLCAMLVHAAGEANVVDWTEEFYNMLQNKVGGGKPKMRWYFGKNGWPKTDILGCVCPCRRMHATRSTQTLPTHTDTHTHTHREKEREIYTHRHANTRICFALGCDYVTRVAVVRDMCVRMYVCVCAGVRRLAQRRSRHVSLTSYRTISQQSIKR